MMKVCFLPHNWHYLNDFEPVIKALQNKGVDFEIVVLEPAKEQTPLFRRLYSSKLIELAPLPAIQKAGRLKKKIPFFGLTIQALLLLGLFKKFIKNKQYSHLILTEDRNFMPLLFLKAARRAKVGKIITYPCQDTITIERKKRHRAKTIPAYNLKRTLAFYLAKILYPHNSAKCQKRNVYIYPPKMVLALWWLGLFPKNPWVGGSNKGVRTAAVNTSAQKQEMLKAKVSPEKIALVGFPPDDRLSGLLKMKKELKEKIGRSLNINPNQKIFLIIGTHFFELFKQNELPAVYDCLNKVLEIILEHLGISHQIIFKVHPRLGLKDQGQIIEPALREKIVFISDEKQTAELIAVSDAVLDFISSATMAGLATNLPIFSFKLPQHPSFEEITNHYQSIIPLRGLEELSSWCRRLQNELIFDKTMEAKRLIDRHNFGIFDGKNTERFLQLLCSTKKNCKKSPILLRKLG